MKITPVFQELWDTIQAVTENKYADETESRTCLGRDERLTFLIAIHPSALQTNLCLSRI